MAAKSPSVQNGAGLPTSSEPVWSVPPESLTATILSGQATSGTVEAQGKLVAIIMPAAWTAADLTIEVSMDGTNFFSVYDDGTLRTIVSAQAQAGRLIALALGDWLFANWVRAKSSVNQGADRVITFVIAR